MKTIVLVDLGSHGAFWKSIGNSIPEGWTLSMQVAVPHKHHETQTAIFKVNRGHASVEKDMRVLELKTEQGWNAFQLRDVGWKQFGRDRPPYQCEHFNRLDDVLSEDAIKEALAAWKVTQWVDYSATSTIAA
jgi:hypothetical protein